MSRPLRRATIAPWPPPTRDALACAALTAGWLATIGLIGVRGEFPLNDDWAFARTAWRLLETGEFDRVAWVYATSIPNVLLGAGVSALFGPSFEVLRASTLVMGWLGVLGTYLLCRQAPARPAIALLAAVVFGWNPIHLNLSFTFMSDVPFTTLTTWTLVAGTIALRRRSTPALVGAAALGATAVATRQPGLALFLSLPLAVVLARPGRPRQAAALAGALALALLVAWVVGGGLAGGDDLQAPFTLARYVRGYLLSDHAAYHVATQAPVAVAYLGWFLAPLAWVGRPAAPGDRRAEGAALVVGGIALVALLAAGRTMPLGMNIVHERGVGPRQLPGVESLPHAPEAWWIAVTALAVLGASASGVRIARAFWRRRDRWAAEIPWLWLLLFPLIYASALVVRKPFFDRYLLTCLPPLLALLAGSAGVSRVPSPARSALGATLALLLAGHAVVGTRDYLEHHRARWALLGASLEAGIPPERIDGGFEFGGLYLFDPAWRWVVDDTYRISYEDRMEGYVPIARRSYRTLFPPGREWITMHRRAPGASGAP